MRYEKGHKEATRRRILEVAGRRFRRDGVEAVGLATLMADAGLTHGGFYSHFTSKEDLVQASLSAAVPSLREMYETVAREGLEALIRHYLTTTHRDQPEAGCIVAALGAEMSRHTAASRKAFSDYAVIMTDLIAGCLPGTVPVAARPGVAQGILAVLVGALELARAVDDPVLSDTLLNNGVIAALALAGQTPS